MSLRQMHVLALPFTTVMVVIFASNPLLAPYFFRLLIFYSFFTIFAALYYLYARHSKIASKAPTLFIYILTVTLLLIIGATGWTISPFFYFIYLLIIFYIQVFPLHTVMAFIVTFFGFTTGYFNIPLSSIIDKLVIVCLLLPVARFMQVQYLKRSESEKKILILEEKDKPYKDTAEQYMGNKISKLGFDMRQMLGDIVQIAKFNEQKLTHTKEEVALEHIEELAKSAIERVDQFEEDSTGRKILHSSINKNAKKKG